MYQIRRMFGDDVLFQIEVPVESVLVACTPSALRPALAGRTSPPNLGRREPDAAMAAMDRIKLLLSDRPPAGLD
jgi:hypothetical protein